MARIVNLAHIVPPAEETEPLSPDLQAVNSNLTEELEITVSQPKKGKFYNGNL